MYVGRTVSEDVGHVHMLSVQHVCFEGDMSFLTMHPYLDTG